MIVRGMIKIQASTDSYCRHRFTKSAFLLKILIIVQQTRGFVTSVYFISFVIPFPSRPFFSTERRAFFIFRAFLSITFALQKNLDVLHCKIHMQSVMACYYKYELLRSIAESVKI